MATVTNIRTLSSAMHSVNGRLKRLRKVCIARNYLTRDTPIESIGCFEGEIQALENTYRGMLSRLERAKVIIPD